MFKRLFPNNQRQIPHDTIENFSFSLFFKTYLLFHHFKVKNKFLSFINYDPAVILMS